MIITQYIMNFSPAIQNELNKINSADFTPGTYIYMGMGKLNGRTVCIAVAYKIDYCIKKSEQFVKDIPAITFDHINKVKTGELMACCRFEINLKQVCH
ncbi:hypothetical protein ACLOAU_18000 [Niabella sp. CJ426]|uniref:hypothetical protein n=2 Tax=unclassified Niabella TaxID=2646634 RepID=UPI003CFDBFD0